MVHKSESKATRHSAKLKIWTKSLASDYSPEDAPFLLRRVELGLRRALERFGELRNVRDSTVHAVPVRRVRVRPHPIDSRLWLNVLCPDPGEGDEEQLVACVV